MPKKKTKKFNYLSLLFIPYTPLFAVIWVVAYLYFKLPTWYAFVYIGGALIVWGINKLFASK